ncbi:hypothetical protein BDV59DRAFT_209620 [Aspergillus ambiguus]|uniref:uncharacterized protein n=1 Tax=Aspergillus ambiguus TaxID=176160 RepID=UPI003CCDFCC7
MSGINQEKVTPIAIVGCGGRFPGDASNPDRLWEILRDSKSTLSETPRNRFNVDAFYHPQPSRPGSQNFKGGHFMNLAIDAFDAPFFTIPPSEARAMDPQQRMCLEVAYEALENAGVPLSKVSGSPTSCYVGCFNHDYRNILNKDETTLPFYNATGTEASCLSNRVSWFFNLAGPSMTVDTACSSSLVALHLACQSIRAGESEMLSNLQMISPDSKSQTFDTKANGYGRGEGTCFIVIKSLDKAIADDDVIRAVICNSGSNQDGNTPGLTLPSRNMQETLIRKVYEEAGLRMEETGYFEAHGTGTVAETIVKANIGHLEGGSGLAAGIIPPQICPRRASVNSFGFAGANAHVILEDADSYLQRRSIHSPTRSQTSSDDSGFLGSGLVRMSELWKGQSGNYNILKDLAYTAARRRTHFPWRSFAVLSRPEDMISGAADLAPPVRTLQKPKFAFVFTGQGAQHYAMGRRLMEYDELLRDEDQPLCIALQVALVDLLRSLGVWPPEFVIGALTSESAWKVAYYRGRLGIDGDMLAAGIELVVGCVNSPTSVTLSGDVLAIIEAEKLIKVNRAYHSGHMKVVADISPKMYSCVTGELIHNSELGGEYWVTNLLMKNNKGYSSVNLLLEIGPHGALQGPCTSISILDRKKDAAQCLLEAIANFPPTSGVPKLLVDLPPYPWNHSNRYWHESAIASDLLGLRDNEDNPYQPRWRQFLRLSENPWMEDHRVQGKIIYPAAGMLTGRRIEGFELRDVSIKTAIIIPKGEEARSQASEPSGWMEFSIYSRISHDPWVQNCTETDTFTDETVRTNALYHSEYMRARKTCQRHIQSDEFYNGQWKFGLEFGETLQNMVCFVRTPNHLIHPCTLDPIIHSSLAILNGGNAEKGASVPISVGRMVISGKVSSDPGTVFSVHSSAKSYGLKGGELSIRASTREWDKPLIIFDKLRVTHLSGGSSTKDGLGGEMREIASKMHWDLDVSQFKDGNIEKFHNYRRLQDTRIRSVDSFIRLLGHKHPDLKILEVGVDNDEITGKLLASLKGRDGESTPWLQQYTATSQKLEDVERLQKLFSSWGPYFRAVQLTPDRRWEDQGLEPHGYDCVVVKTEIGTSETDELLARLRPFLKDQGSLIILPSSFPPEFHGVLNSQLRRHKFTGLDYSGTEDAGAEAGSLSSVPFLISSLDNGTACVPDEIVVVGPSKPSSMFHSLKKRLEAHEVEAVHTTLCGTENIDIAGKNCIIISDLERPILFDITAKNFLLLKRLLLESQSTTWVTSGATIECSNPKAALVTGLVRTIRQEHPEILLTTLDLDPTQSDNDRNVSFVIHILRRHAAGDIDHEFAVRDDYLLIPRIQLERRLNHYSSILRDGPTPQPSPLKQHDRNLALRLGIPGLFDSIYFDENPSMHEPLRKDDIEIEVKASGLSSIDLHSALDQVRDPVFGHECSGVVRKIGSNVTNFKMGDRVMTWCSGAFANIVQRGVGQAAIMIAQNLGAEVCVTVESREKRSHLMETYGIQQDRIFHSRQVNFSQGIMRVTKSTGIDVVLNCLSGESVQNSLACLAPFGRFIEIGKRWAAEHSDIDALSTKNLSFHLVDIVGLFNTCSDRASKLFENAIKFYHGKNCQPATPLMVKGFSEIADGMRLLRSGEHIGKIVFKADDFETVMAIPPAPKPAEFHANATYIIIGGFGGLGHHIAKWMAENGARNLVFLSRSGANQPHAKSVLADIESKGAKVKAYKCDIGHLEQVEKVMNEITAEGQLPVRGIVQAAMSLADSTFRQMTPKQWELSTNTKALGTWNIHVAAPRDVDFFIMLSSVSGVIGLRGQANYAAGNTFLDALAHYRRSQGMTAMSLDVGAVFDVGYMAQKPDMKDVMRSLGFIGLTGAELAGIIQAGITDTEFHHSDHAQVIIGLASGGYLAAEGIDLPYYFSDPKMSHLKQIGATGEGGNNSGPGLPEQLNKAVSRASATEAVSEALRARLAKQMMVNIEDVDASKPVSGYGVDSLTAVDIRAWSLKEAQADISILDIVNNSAIMSLAQTIVERSRILESKKLED